MPTKVRYEKKNSEGLMEKCIQERNQKKVQNQENGVNRDIVAKMWYRTVKEL